MTVILGGSCFHGAQFIFKLFLFFVFLDNSGSVPVGQDYKNISMNSGQPIVVVNTYQTEDHNFQARYKYGNKRQHGITIRHWLKFSTE